MEARCLLFERLDNGEPNICILYIAFCYPMRAFYLYRMANKIKASGKVKFVFSSVA